MQNSAASFKVIAVSTSSAALDLDVQVYIDAKKYSWGLSEHTLTFTLETSPINISTSVSDNREESSDFWMKLEAIKYLKQFSRIMDSWSAFKNSVDILVSYTCSNMKKKYWNMSLQKVNQREN